MFASFNDIFDKKKQKELAEKAIEDSLIRYGEECLNCDYAIYIQPSSYYDYVTCMKNNSIKISPGERGIRCDDYERLKIEVSE